MAAVGPLKFAYLAYLSSPRGERLLYQQVRRLRARRIVEIGMGAIERAVNLVTVAQRYTRDQTISYTGLDWFEEREAGLAPLPLIHAHRQLQLTTARIRLVPGFPPATLPQIANSLQRTDLILISGRLDDAALERAWFYMPRMCHSPTVVLREVGDGENTRLQSITLAELEQRAAVRGRRTAA